MTRKKKGRAARATGSALVEGPKSVLRELGSLTFQTYRVSKSFGPLVKLLSDEKDVTRPALAAAMDTVFEALYAHPVTRSAERITTYLRKRSLIPNEQSTEELMRFVVDQLGVNTEVTNLRARAARVLPLPSSVRSRWLPAPLPVPAQSPT